MTPIYVSEKVSHKGFMPRICTEFLQIKKKKTTVHGQFQKSNCSTRVIMKISGNMFQSPNPVFILHRASPHLPAF